MNTNFKSGNRVSRFLTLVAFIAMSLAAGQICRAQEYVVDGDTYAAIAYSPSTGKFHYAYNLDSRAAAEKAALAGCTPSDARIVAWVNAGWCALALGDDHECWGVGWSYGDGATIKEAVDYALEECRSRTTNVELKLLVLSDGQLVYEVVDGDSDSETSDVASTAKR